MLKKVIVFTLIMIMIIPTAVFADGTLVIVGGALRSDNDEVYQAFIDAAGPDAVYGVVPVASGSPIKYFELFKADLMARGVLEENIKLIKLAVKNDKRTDEDESLWQNNASNQDEIDKVNACDAIWFVGGDQLRITETLLGTPMLDAIRDVYSNGGVIGGTSAGAAMMSEMMIAGGDSFGALYHGQVQDFDDSTLDYQNQGGLVTSQGLGFFKEGIVDQHFDRKGRLGRLIVVTYDSKASTPMGYGVEENTAMIYNGKTKEISVAGTGGLVIVDVSQASHLEGGYYGVHISYLESVDKFQVESKDFMMDESKYTTLGYEYMYTSNPIGSGAVSSNQTLKHLIAYNLVDNEAADSVSTFLFDYLGRGYEFRFYNGDLTEGYWGQNGAADLYSFEHVLLDITPVNVSVTNKTGHSMLSHMYKVVEGDRLVDIASKHKVALEDLVKANSIGNPNLILVGQELIIPN